MPHSGMPGPPIGPAPAQDQNGVVGARRCLCTGAIGKVVVIVTTYAGPRCAKVRVAAERLMSAPSGARLPRTTRKAPSASTGSVEIVNDALGGRRRLHLVHLSAVGEKRVPREVEFEGAKEARGTLRRRRGLRGGPNPRVRRRRVPASLRPTRSTSSSESRSRVAWPWRSGE
jgi:hypothetical protein